MSDAPVVRPLDAAGVQLALDWAAAEGWNPGLEDAAPFRALDPAGFLGLFVDGGLAASISAVVYDERFGFIGFYICRPDLRGRGLGRRLWDAALARLGGRMIGLDGVVAQQANYAKSGFVLAHRNIRYGGRPSSSMPPPSGIVEVGADAALADAVIAYDRPLFPAPREAFLRAWVNPRPTRRTLAFIRDGAVAGYGTIRACRDGSKIGPLFADDAGIAAALFAGLAAPVEGASIALDIPEPNAEARRLAEGLGMAPVFETARMYRGEAPGLPLGRVFGITTFELG